MTFKNDDTILSADFIVYLVPTKKYSEAVY